MTAPVAAGTLVLTIAPTGAVSGVYDDRLGLQRLGAMEVTRFGEVRFNNETQRFDLHVVKDGLHFTAPYLQGFESYTAGTAFERQWLTSLVAHDAAPASALAETLARAIRWPT